MLFNPTMCTPGARFPHTHPSPAGTPKSCVELLAATNTAPLGALALLLLLCRA